MSIISRAALIAVAFSIPQAAAFAETLTLDQAIARAVDAAPSLRASEASVAAARAGRVQANARPNPFIEVEAENIAGTGNYSVLEQPEITASYNHVLERGGKRAARVALADRDIAVAEAQSSLARLDLAAQVQRAYLDVLVADEAADIAANRLVIERGLQSEAVRRVRAAKDPLFVETRAAARVAEAKLAVDQAGLRSASARAVLASYWGGTGEAIEAKGDTLTIAKVIDGSTASAVRLAEADQTLADAEIARASAATEVERRRASQDYTISGGARYLRGTNDVAVVAGVTIPLARFDRNRGNIERAQAERQRLEFTAEAARLQRLRQLASLRRDAQSAQARAAGIEREIIPRSTKALAQVQEGYARGGFTFRDMQDAADGIFSAYDAYLAALSDLRATQADIDRLTGRFAPTLSTETPR